MAVSLEQFVENLTKSGLFSAAELAAFQESLPPERRPTNVQSLARELVHAGKLTKYQAALVYQGKTAGLVLGDYVILDEIGAGGMGQVFKAWRRSMERTVALKVLPAKGVRSRESVQRFHREVKAAARLEHPNIVTAYDAGEAEGVHFLVMQYVEGKDLARVLVERGPLPVAEAVDYTIQAAKGLEYAHRRGIVHRDIKPGNLLLDQEGTVKILDMGLARIDEPPGPQAQTAPEALTESGQVMGTYDYMAPEQAQDTHRADHRADIYSLGCTLYRLLTSRKPYEGETPVQVLLAHHQSPIPSLCEVREDVPPQLDVAFQKMLAKAPADRQQSMGEVISELEACIRPVAPPAPEPPTPPPIQWPAPTPSSSGDRALKAFFQKLSQKGTAATQKARAAGEETLTYHAEEETAPPIGQPPMPSGQPTNRTLVYLGGGALGLILVLGFLLAVLGPGKKGQGPSASQTGMPRVDDTEKKKAPAPAAEAEIRERVEKPEVEVSGWEAAWAESDAKAKALIAEQRFGEAEALYQELNQRFEHVELNRRVADAVAALQEQAKTAYQEIEAQAKQLVGQQKFADARTALDRVVKQHGIPASAEAAQKLSAEIDAAEAQAKGEAARKADIERQQEIEGRYAEAMEPVEELVAAWDFRGASEVLTKVHFEEEELTARLAAWVDGVNRLEDLKVRIIAKINTADPRLKKSDLMIRGAGGELAEADESGVTAKLSRGKIESLAWPDVGPQAVEKLIGLVSTPDDAGAWLAAGVLALASKDPASGEEHFEQARSLGAEIGPYLAPLAASGFAKAKDLLEAKKFSEADALLANLEAKYTQTAWFRANRAAFEAVQAQTKAGIFEAEAEKLYTEAAALFEKEQLFDVKPFVEKLRHDYADSQAVTDAARKPSFAELQEAVGDLGRFITVRLDGKGDFTSIQAAVDAVPPNSLIEIQDNGPYYEKVVVPEDRRGLTLRGMKQCWPAINSGGTLGTVGNLMVIKASQVALERLLIVHKDVGGEGQNSLVISGPCRLRSVIFAGAPSFSIGPDSQMEKCCFGAWSNNGHVKTPTTIRNSIAVMHFGIDGSAKAVLENVLIPTTNLFEAPFELRFCTVSGQTLFPEGESSALDSILGSVQARREGNRIDYCNVVSGKFVDLARPGKGCFSADPQFVDPKNLDYRLLPTSPCIGKASDGGDLGCRYTPEMIEMCRKALELRAQGIIKF